jgi:hypothetical protein
MWSNYFKICAIASTNQYILFHLNFERKTGFRNHGIQMVSLDLTDCTLIFFFRLLRCVGNTYLVNTRSASSVLAALFLGSYSVTIGRKLVACKQKKTSFLNSDTSDTDIPQNATRNASCSLKKREDILGFWWYKMMFMSVRGYMYILILHSRAFAMLQPLARYTDLIHMHLIMDTSRIFSQGWQPEYLVTNLHLCH